MWKHYVLSWIHNEFIAPLWNIAVTGFVRFNILSTVICWAGVDADQHGFVLSLFFLSVSIYLSTFCASSFLSQLDLWNHPWRINWWLLRPLICHNYFISDWSDYAIADSVCAEAPFLLVIKGSHFNWSLFNTNCSPCCKSVSVSLSRPLLSWQFPCFILYRVLLHCITVWLTVKTVMCNQKKSEDLIPLLCHFSCGFSTKNDDILSSYHDEYVMVLVFARA